MKRTNGKRIWSMILVICLMLSMLPVFVSQVEIEAEAAVSGVDSLTCAGFISNSTRQNYIDVMMKYYINSNSNLQSALTGGDSVVFMFEGGSDYYDTYEYIDANGTTRLQAVCIVVQMKSGSAQIVFYSENCSSIPDDANYVTAGYETSGSTTILDGIYSFQTVNHNGNYAGFNTGCYTGWYNPYSGSTGYSGYCDGINIHTRSVSYCAGASYGWCNSAGCQVIGYGANSSNEYNTFVKTITGVTFNAYDGTQRTYAYGSVSTYVHMGYYVVDRQLGLLSPDGTEYGSGSLAELYTTADLDGITKFSTNARANANFEYASECTSYPAHCQIKTTDSATVVNSQPCSAGNNDSETLETVGTGVVYTATGLFQNEYGNYWYRVTTSSGETGYIYGGDCVYVDDIITDVTISGHSTPNGHVAGNYFVVNGTISSKYNKISTAAVWIHEGFGTSGTKTIGYSDTVNGYSYSLSGSTIDNNTTFDSLSTGQYTYAIYADYINYYSDGATTLKSNTGTINLVAEYFMTVSSSVDQSSCSHSYTTTTIGASTCTESGTKIQSCATCGKIVETAIAAGGHSYGSWTTVAATCTADGYKTRTCSACGNVEKQTIAATGHSYSQVTHAGNCQEYERVEYICGTCGDNYFTYAEELYSAWSTTKPTGVDESLIQSKTQYRYSDYETTTSYETSLSGYTQLSSEWVKSGTNTVNYVNSWPSGFSTSNSLYTKYNNKSSKVTASETSTTKTEINSDAVVGYLWYHWCYTDSYYSLESSSGSYTTFHAFYADTLSYTDYDSSDGSYENANSSVCTNGDWYWYTEVYAQKSTTYNKLFTYERWTDYSAWSDTAVTASDTRKVETQTVYRYVNAELGDHTWSNGTCSVCGTVCGHSYTNGYCTVCGLAEPVKDFYLFGYINGANYGCEEDYETIGEYKFEDGQLVVTFSAVSYVAVKSADNTKWYMTNGYAGDDATSVTLYTTDITGTNSDKLRVPKGREITFTLVQNDDGSLTLSYVAAGCEHSWSDGVCSICDEVCDHDWNNGACATCGTACAHSSWTSGICDTCGKTCYTHSYSNNVCTNCGATKPVKDYYLFGYINGANYACEEDYATIGIYKFENGKLVATFESDSYVAVKSGDNTDWYMTNGWQGTEVTSVTLYNNNSGITSEKMYVPGGVEVTFTLVDNGDDTFTLSYVAAEVAVVAPTTSLTGASLAFEDEIYYNIYFTADDLSSVVEMGLVTFNEKLSDGTIENAVDVIPGYEIVGSEVRVHTNGIPAKNMGDALYFRVYALLTDGSYVYGNVSGYHAGLYAKSKLGSTSSSDALKALCVAMVNYGAEAQTYFGYNTDNLMNAFLTDTQKALISAYDSTLVDAVVSASSTKAANFTKNGFSKLSSAVSFEGAFAINYYFTPANTVDGEMTLYWWDAATYNSVSVLTKSNATGSVVMTGTSEYAGAVDGIAAKELDQTIYVVGVYTSGGTEYTTGVLAYSIGHYCKTKAAGTTTMADLAAATAVYGYYAKQYFA